MTQLWAIRNFVSRPLHDGGYAISQVAGFIGQSHSGSGRPWSSASASEDCYRLGRDATQGIFAAAPFRHHIGLMLGMAVAMLIVNPLFENADA